MTTETTLDEKIALALGYQRIEFVHGPGRFYWENGAGEYGLPQFSETWQGAGMVIEAMRERGYEWSIWDRADRVGCLMYLPIVDGEDEPRVAIEEIADTMPVAVCLAALAALEGER